MQFPMYQDTNTIARSLITLQKDMYAYCASTEDKERETLKQEAAENKKNALNAMDDFYGFVGPFKEGDENYETWNALVNDVNTYADYFDQIVTLCDAGKTKEANKLLWGDVQKSGESLSGNINGMSNDNLNEIQGVLKNQNGISVKAKTEGLIVVGVMIAIAVICVGLIQMNIVKPINMANKSLTALVEQIEKGEGDLTVRIRSFFNQ